MARVVSLIRSESLSDVAQYAYAATAPSGGRLIFSAVACPFDGRAGDYAAQAEKR